MRVVLSWSQPTSHALALAFRDWLPLVVQAIRPWVSSEDIGKGAAWATELDASLADARAAIVFVTPENLNAPWLHFEAGVLRGSPEGRKVCTFLWNVSPTDVSGPLALFQHTKHSRSDILLLLQSLNGLLETPLDGQILERALEFTWDSLSGALEHIGTMPKTVPPKRDDRQLLEEILSVVRQRDQSESIREITSLLARMVEQLELQSAVARARPYAVPAVQVLPSVEVPVPRVAAQPVVPPSFGALERLLESMRASNPVLFPAHMTLGTPASDALSPTTKTPSRRVRRPRRSKKRT